MSDQGVADDDTVRAQILAQQLEEKIGKYFPERPRPERQEEMSLLKAQIEKLGFKTSYSIILDPSTLACTATVTLTPVEKPSVLH